MHANKIQHFELDQSSYIISTSTLIELNIRCNELDLSYRLNLTDKILDTVGVNGKLQDSLEEEILKKRTIKVPSLFDDDKFTKWTAIREPPFNNSVESSAVARARQSRARLADIESEIDAVTQKGLAREKRLNNLKALIAGEDPFLDTNDSFKSTKVSKTVKKVTF